VTSLFSLAFDVDIRTFGGLWGERLCFVTETEPHGTYVIGIVLENLSVILWLWALTWHTEKRGTSPSKNAQSDTGLEEPD
jgi:hypothetical protein